MFPSAEWLRNLAAESYCAIPLSTSDRIVYGHIALLDDAPMLADFSSEPLFRTFAAQISAEIERNHAIEALTESHNLLHAVINDISDVVFIKDIHGRCVLINQAGAEFLGLKVDDVIGRSDFDLLPTEVAERLVDRDQTIVRTGQPSTFEESVSNVGSDRIHFTTKTPYRDKRSGEILGVIGIARDVTDRLAAERARRKSDLRLRLITDNVPGMLVYIGQDGRHDYANPQYAELFDCEPDDIVGKTTQAIMGDVNYGRLGGAIEIALGGETTSIQCCLSLPDRPEVWLDAHYYPELDEAGNVQGVFAQLLDVSEQKQAEERLRVSEEQLRQLLENHVDGVMVMLDGQIVYANDRCCEFTGYSREELLGLSPLDLISDDDADIFRQRLTSLMEGDSVSFSREYSVRAKDGSVSPIEASSRVMRFRGEKAVMSVLRDVSERYETAERLRRLEAELSHMARHSTLGELASGLAHEVNQPLTAIANYADTARQAIEESPSIAGILAMLQNIEQQAYRAGDIINSVRRLVQRGEPKNSTVEINEIVRQVVRLMRSEATVRKIHIELRLADPLPTVVAERTQIQQIVLNLIRNGFEAIEAKQSDMGQLVIFTEPLPEKGVKIIVQDNGIGLPTEDRENIFEAFQTTKKGALGMGLAITRSIVEAHGGKSWAESLSPVGTQFHVEIGRDGS